MNQFWRGNECEILTHSQQQPQAPNAHKMESTVRLTTRITMLQAPQRSLHYRLKDSIEVKLNIMNEYNELLFSLEKRNENFQFCTKMYMGSTRNGIEFGFNSQTVLILLLLLKSVCGIELLSFNKKLRCT